MNFSNCLHIKHKKCITLIKRGSHGSLVVLVKPIWRRFTPFTLSGSSSLVRSIPYKYWASSRNMAYNTRKGEHLIMERRWLGRIHKMLAHSSNMNVNQLWYVMLQACTTIHLPCVRTITSIWLERNIRFSIYGTWKNLFTWKSGSHLCSGEKETNRKNPKEDMATMITAWAYQLAINFFLAMWW
jgi:hypothetical protein